jgi:glycosyltransferase involved in cell wall biosynthesis
MPDPIPAVSVVVPCYNGARFIDQLMATLAGQTFRDFETIIVDDGSGEETRQKLASLGQDVKVIHQVNQGPGAADLPRGDGGRDESGTGRRRALVHA